MIPRRRLCAMLLVLCALACALWLGRARLASRAGSFLVQADPVEPASLIFLLNGDLDTRPPAAAGLWKKGIAPKIAIARSESSRATSLGLVPNVTDIAVGMLLRMGVPRQAIVELPFPGGVTSTRDEALALRDYLSAHGAERLVVVVTNEIHTRRARWLYGRVFRGLPVRFRFAAIPDRRFRPERWWVNEYGFLGVFNEYLKLAYYRWRY